MAEKPVQILTATQRAALRMMIVPSTDRKDVRVWKMTRSMTVAKRSWKAGTSSNCVGPAAQLRTWVYIASEPLPAFSLCSPIVTNNCAPKPKTLWGSDERSARLRILPDVADAHPINKIRHHPITVLGNTSGSLSTIIPTTDTTTQ